ncbi:MAG TPA: hypothetical protein VF152_08665 [Acidimicrobiia bacterium]
MTPPREIAGHCPQYERAVEILGRRWTGLIVRALLAGRVVDAMSVWGEQWVPAADAESA